MIELEKSEIFLYRIRCDNCHKPRESYSDSNQAAREGADREGWLWNGEEDWCPKCLEELANQVP